MDRLANPRAADAVTLKHDRRQRIQPEAPRFCLIAQQVHIARPLMAEAPILSHRNRAHRRGGQPSDKFRGLHRCHRWIEMQRNQKFHSQPADHAGLVVARFQKCCRCLVRSDHLDRMRIKGEHSRQAAIAPRRLHRSANHCLMPEMHAVEHAERQMQLLSERGQFLKPVANQHAAVIAIILLFIKPARSSPPCGRRER